MSLNKSEADAQLAEIDDVARRVIVSGFGYIACGLWMRSA